MESKQSSESCQQSQTIRQIQTSQSKQLRKPELPDSSGTLDSPDTPESPDSTTFSHSTTQRGFGLVTFQDASGRACSLQESSAVGGFVWLGVDDADPKRFIPHVGYQNYPLPEGVLLSTRMHLAAEAALKLADELRKIAERVIEREDGGGSIEGDGEDWSVEDAVHPLE